MTVSGEELKLEQGSICGREDYRSIRTATLMCECVSFPFIAGLCEPAIPLDIYSTCSTINSGIFILLSTTVAQNMKMTWAGVEISPLIPDFSHLGREKSELSQNVQHLGGRLLLIFSVQSVVYTSIT